MGVRFSSRAKTGSSSTPSSWLTRKPANVTPAVWWGTRNFQSCWFPDGKRLLYNESHRESGTIRETILVHDLQTGRNTELFRATPARPLTT